MKLLLAIVLLVSALLTSARAQQDADSRYITIYSVIQQADNYVSQGQAGDALASYKDAQAQLQKFQQIYPDWQPDIVSYRLSDLDGKIAALQAQMPTPAATAATNAPTAAPTAATGAPATAPSTPAVSSSPPVNNLQLDVLQSQLQSLKDQNAQLQAKLQEALSAQPQMVDASELTNAQNQIRELMKENDLLKASVATSAPASATTTSVAAPATPAPDAEVTQLRSQLADTAQKLADEEARAQKLEEENASLELSLTNSGKQVVDNSSALRDENDRLKSQLDSMQAAALQTAANNSATASDTATRLSAAKAQIDALQSAVMLANLEKTALEDRLKRARSQLEQTNATIQASVQDLTAQRDDLIRKLTATSAQNAQYSDQANSNATQTAALQLQIAALETRITEQEAKVTAGSNEQPAPTLSAPVVAAQSTPPEAQPAPVAAPAPPVVLPSAPEAPQPAPVVAQTVSPAEAQPAPVVSSPPPVVEQPAPAVVPAPPAQPAPAQQPVAQPETAPVGQPAPSEQPAAPAQPAASSDTAELEASAQQHFANHEYELAESDYRKVLEHDQNNGLALANLATIEMQENKLPDAERDVEAALALSPDDAFNLAMLGKVKFTEGLNDEALGKNQSAQEDYDQALTSLGKAAKLDPSNAETQNYLGVTYSHKGMRAQAEAALRRAIAIDPNYAPAHNNIAVIYITQNPPLPQLARWHYLKALDAGQPRNPDLEKLLALKGAPVTVQQQ